MANSCPRLLIADDLLVLMLCLGTFSPPAPSFSLSYIFIVVMNVFQRRRRKSSKGRVLLCPIDFLLQFDLCQSLWWFELRFCFAWCLLDCCNSGLHLSPESPDSWKVIFTLRARKESFLRKKKKKKGNPDDQHCREQSLTPKRPAKRPWGSKEETYCSLSFQMVCKKREIGKMTISFITNPKNVALQSLERSVLEW